MRIARLHLITPEPLDEAASVATAAALAAGARWVQIRVKGGTDRARWEAVQPFVARARALGATCLVNDRADVALAAGAAGVHLGLDDLPVGAVRAVAPAGFVIGATVRNAEQARRKADEGADYLGVGPVYATTTKDGLPPPSAWRASAQWCGRQRAGHRHRGITLERVPEVLAQGVHGLAVVGAVTRADDLESPPGRRSTPGAAIEAAP